MKKRVNKSKISFSNKLKYFLLIAIFFSIILIVYSQTMPIVSHDADKILVRINGYSMTLQEALNNGYLNGSSTPSSNLTTSLTGSFHNSENIFVSVNGIEQTLQQAINNSLCGNVTSNYSSNTNFGHNGGKIIVGEKTLQQAINEGDFCQALPPPPPPPPIECRFNNNNELTTYSWPGPTEYWKWNANSYYCTSQFETENSLCKIIGCPDIYNCPKEYIGTYHRYWTTAGSIWFNLDYEICRQALY
ncbi:MAG: hypothetical protein ABIH72_00415 [archaeon]